MSLLEAFFLEFGSNAKDIEKDTKKAEQASDNLEKKLKQTDAAAGKLGSTLHGVAQTLYGAILASFGAGTILAGIKSAITYANELGKASDHLGISVSQLDAWGTAVEKVGGTTQGFIQTIKALSTHLNQVDIYGFRPATQEFARLGIGITDSKGKLKDVLSLLPEIARVFEKFSQQRSYAIGKQLGLDDHTITLLQKGQKETLEFVKRQKELGIVTKEDAELAQKFNMQWQDTTHAFRSVFTLVGSTVLPVITAIAKAFEKTAIFFRKHSDFIVGALIAIGSALLYIVTPAVISTLAAFAPFLIIGGIFAFLYDEISGFIKGHDSLLGRLIEKYPRIGEILKSIIADLKLFKTEVSQAIEALSQFLGGLAFDLKNMFMQVFDFIIKGIDKITSAYQAVKSFLGFGDTTIKNNIETAQSAITAASNSPLASQTTNSLTALTRNNSRNTTVQTGPITINTQATDAEQIAFDFRSVLDKELRNATADFDDGLLA